MVIRQTRRRLSLLVLIMSVIPFASVRGSAVSASDLSPHWVDTLRLDALTDVDARMQMPEASQLLRLIKNPEEHPEMRTVSTCAEYLSAVADGFGPQTARQVAAEGTFIRDCYVLRDLKSARPSVVSYVPHGWSSDALSELPPLLQIGDRYGETNVQQPWASVAGAKLLSVETDSVSIEDGGNYYAVRSLAWADFNGDGFEDIAVVVNAHAKDGTDGAAGYYVLTRCQHGGRLRVITAPTREYLRPRGAVCQ